MTDYIKLKGDVYANTDFDMRFAVEYGVLEEKGKRYAVTQEFTKFLEDNFDHDSMGELVKESGSYRDFIENVTTDAVYEWLEDKNDTRYADEIIEIMMIFFESAVPEKSFYREKKEE